MKWKLKYSSINKLRNLLDKTIINKGYIESYLMSLKNVALEKGADKNKLCSAVRESKQNRDVINIAARSFLWMIKALFILGQ